MKHSSESVMTNKIGPEVCLDLKSAKKKSKRRLWILGGEPGSLYYDAQMDGSYKHKFPYLKRKFSPIELPTFALTRWGRVHDL